MKPRWECYLIFNKNGVIGFRKESPQLRSGEFAVKINLKVPMNIFNRRFPEASIAIPEHAVIEPKVEVLSPHEETTHA